VSAPDSPVADLPYSISAADSRFAEQATRRWTSVHVASSHVTGCHDSGRLTLRFTFHSDGSGRRREDEVWFEVPPDFHAHNDGVAAAAMTLLGASAGRVAFDFAISDRCASILRAYYRLADVAPVDPSLEPRRPGRWLGLNFSGGMDSTVVKTLLDEILPGEFKLVTTAYGGPYTHEALGYAPHRPHVVCRTNFRAKHYVGGRFNAAVPLLFADYLDLAALTTGHSFTQNPVSTESLVDGAMPRFRVLEAALEAGGLPEVHLVRGLNEPGMLKAIAHLPGAELEQTFNGSSPPSSSKYRLRGTILRQMRAAASQPIPEFIRDVTLHPRTGRFGGLLGGMLQALYVARYVGVDAIREFSPGIEDVPADWFAGLTLDFATRYNTNFISLVPAHLRAPLLGALARRGIEPYRERDWHELAAVQAYREALQPHAPN
jgi:hypothetical protein